jgi:Domain of unknown function (DUF4386)
MTESAIETSPRRYARIGGVLYLVIILLGLFGEMFVRDRLVVSGDAKATAANIASQESLWRIHIGTELLLLICAIALLVILFVLLRPVNKDLALLVAFLNLISIGIEAATAMYLVEAVFPLGSAAYLKAFTPEQLDAMATLSIRAHGYGFGVSLIFFGCFCLVIGYLIFISGYFPRAIGVLMQIAGASYLVNSFALILSPAVANRLFPVILFPAFVGESSFCVYLLVKGLNVQRWKERTSAAHVRAA